MNFPFPFFSEAEGIDPRLLVGGGKSPPALPLLFPPKFPSFSSFPKAFAGSVRPSRAAREVEKEICKISSQAVELVVCGKWEGKGKVVGGWGRIQVVISKARRAKRVVSSDWKPVSREVLSWHSVTGLGERTCEGLMWLEPLCWCSSYLTDGVLITTALWSWSS